MMMVKEMKLMAMMVMMKEAKSKVVSEFGRKCDLEAIQAKGHDSYSQGAIKLVKKYKYKYRYKWPKVLIVF